MANHLTLQFSQLHKGRFQAGDLDDIPSIETEAGYSDAYLVYEETSVAVLPYLRVVNQAGSWADLHAPEMVGDAGAGGTRGEAPAPGSGDAAAGKYLKADGTWSVPPGSSGYTFKGCRATRISSTLTLSTASETTLLWNGEDYDTDTMHDTSSNSERIGGFADGEVYRVTCNVYINNNSIGGGNGRLRIYWYDNSGAVATCIAQLSLPYMVLDDPPAGWSLSVEHQVDQNDYFYATFDSTFDDDVPLQADARSAFMVTRIKS